MAPFLTAQKERISNALTPAFSTPATTPEEKQARADSVKKCIAEEDSIIEELHNMGESGVTIASYRSAMIDSILQLAFKIGCTQEPGAEIDKISIVSVGGYGRGLLNPGSDIDILFLLPTPSHKIGKSTNELIQCLLYLLWDTGLKVGHASRSINECITEAKAEQQSKTAMMDARLIAGDSSLFEEFQKTFEKNCILKDQEAFLKLRLTDRRTRHKKYSYTVFLQEPHVKESCGGLRDYHNIQWITRVKRNTKDLNDLVKERILTKTAIKELDQAFDFLHRVRNELHYHTKSSTDILTLRLQGIVATNFRYPEKSILRRCESFMRDYYKHTRNIFNHTNTVMQIFKLEQTSEKAATWKSLFRPKAKREVFDGFIARNDLIYPEHKDIFNEDHNRIMRMFQHCQIKGLHMSPQMRKLVKAQLPIVSSKPFRYSKRNRETFRAMLERKGDVAMNLRRMHRVGVLGAYLPEFGALDCLVQHEFFHRYTADEHTLRCIDELDALLNDDRKETHLYRELFRNVEDPYALYLALILHDSGRAENVREHIDGSAMLASRVCTRLKITGNRRSLISFLVDHHLSFWRYATGRDLTDPAVIEEFAKIMRTKQRLSILLLFTYADSNGTNEEAWSPWKESLILQLYHATLHYLENGKEQFREDLKSERQELYDKVKSLLPEDYHHELNKHFELMPQRYFRFRSPENIATHIKATHRFQEKDQLVEHDKSNKPKWITLKDRAYSELIVTCWNAPLLLEKICCALASEELTIISADVFTRKDNIVCDIFHVCTLNHQPVTDTKVKNRVYKVLSELLTHDDYDPQKYLKRKKNYLRKDPNEGAIPFPVNVFTNNLLSDKYTAIEIQALDRIGLLHDLFYRIGKCGLATVHARICTEKGAAMDTIYVCYPDGSKVTDKEKLLEIENSLREIIS